MADNELVFLHGKPLSSLRVLDLRQELEKRGLSKAGSKTQLVDRLAPQLLLEELQNAPVKDQDTVPNLKLQEEIGSENEYIRQYLTQQQHLYEIQKEAKRRAELESEQVQVVVSEKAIDFSDHGPSHFSDNSSLECESNLGFDVTKDELLPPALFLEGATIDRSADCLIKLDILNEPDYPLPPKLEREETLAIKMGKNKRRSSRIETTLEFEGEKSVKRRKQCEVSQKAAVNKTESSKRKAEAVQLNEVKEKIQEKRQKYSSIEKSKPQINKLKDFPVESKNVRGVKKDERPSKKTVSSVNEDKILVLEIEQLNDEIISKFTRTKKPNELIASKQQKIIETPNPKIVKPNRLTARKQQNTMTTEIAKTNNKNKASKRNSSVETAQIVLEDIKLTDNKKPSRKNQSSETKEVVQMPTNEFIDNRTRHKSPRTQNIKENSEIFHETKTIADNKIVNKKSRTRTSNSREHSKNVEMNELIDKNVLKNKKSVRVSNIKQSESTDNTITTKGSQRTQRAKGNPGINFENNESVNAPMKNVRGRAAVIMEQSEIHLETKESIDNPDEKIKKSPRTLTVKRNPENEESNVNTEIKGVRSRKNPTPRLQSETRPETTDSILKNKRAQRITAVRGPPETHLETKESIDIIKNKKSEKSTIKKRHQETHLETNESVDNKKMKTVRSKKASALREKTETHFEVKESIDNTIVEKIKKSPRNPTVRGYAETNLETKDSIDNVTTKNLSRSKPVRGHPETNLKTNESNDNKIATKRLTRTPALRGHLETDESVNTITKKSSSTTTAREQLERKETIDNTVISKKSSRAISLKRHPETDVETKEPTDNKVRATRIRGHPDTNNETKISIDNRAIIRKTARTTRKRYPDIDLESKGSTDNEEITTKTLVRTKRARGQPETDVETKESINNLAVTKTTARTTRKLPEINLETKKLPNNNEIAKKLVSTKRARGHPKTDVETKESINNSAVTKTTARTTRKLSEIDLETKKLPDNKEIAKTFVRSKRARGHPETDVETKESIDNTAITEKASSNTTRRHQETDLETEKSVDDKVITKKARIANVRDRPEIKNIDNSRITNKSARATTRKEHPETDVATKESIDKTVTALKGQQNNIKIKDSVDSTVITNKVPRSSTSRRYQETVVETEESIDNKLTRKLAGTTVMKECTETDKTVINNKTAKATTSRRQRGSDIDTQHSIDNKVINKTATKTTTITEHPEPDLENKKSINTVVAKKSTLKAKKVNKDTTVSGQLETEESSDNAILNKESEIVTIAIEHPENIEISKINNRNRDTVVKEHLEIEESLDNTLIAKKAAIDTSVIKYPEKNSEINESTENTVITKTSSKITNTKHSETIENIKTNKKSTRIPSLKRLSENQTETKEKLIDDEKVKNEPIIPEEQVLENEHFDKNIKHQDELNLQMRSVENISKDISLNIKPHLEIEEAKNLKDSTLESNLTKNVEKNSCDSMLNKTKEPSPKQIEDKTNNLQMNIKNVNNENAYNKSSDIQVNKDSDTVKEFNDNLKVADQQLKENSLKSISEEFKSGTESSSFYTLEDKSAADLCTKPSLDDVTTKNSDQFKKDEIVELNLCDVKNVVGKLKGSSLKLQEERTDESYVEDKERERKNIENESITKTNNKELESNVMKSKIEANNLVNVSHVEVKAVPYLIKDILDENKTETIPSFENVKDQQANIWEGKSMTVKIKDPFEDSKQIESDNSLESFEELVGSKNKQVEIKSNTLTEEGQTDGDFETFQEILEQAALTTYQVEQLGDESSEFIQKTSAETSNECAQREIDPPLSHIEDISKDSCENIPLFNKRCDDIQELMINEKCMQYQEPPRSTNFPLLVQNTESIKPEVSKKYDLDDVNFLAIDSEKALKKDFDGAFEVNKSETCHNIFSIQESSSVEGNFISHKNLEVDHLPDESSKISEQNRYEQTTICESEKQTNMGLLEEKYESKSNLSQDWSPYETWKTSAANNPGNSEKMNSEPESQSIELSRNRNSDKFIRQEQVVMNREPSRISDSSSSTTSSRRSRSKERHSSNSDRSTVIYRNRNRSRSRSPNREISQTSHRDHYHRNQDTSQQIVGRERTWWTGSRERDQQIENRSRQTENRDSYRRSGGRESFQPFNRREGSWGNQGWENQGWENQSWENQSWDRPWQTQSREMSWQNRSRDRPPRSRSRERSWQSGSRERSQF